MKVFVLLSLVLAFAVVFVHGNGSCLNPLFINCHGTRFCQITFLVTPALNNVNTGICPNLNGHYTCCSQAVFNDITNIWLLLHQDIQAAVDELQYLITNVIDPYLNKLQSIANNVPQYFPNASPTVQNAIQKYLNDVVSASQSLIAIVVHDWANCARGLLNYFAGLVCFACEAQWSSYVFSDGHGGYIVLFDTETCTRVSGSCLTFFEDIVAYEVAIANAAINLINTIGNLNIGSQVPDIDVTFSHCNQSCDTYICYEFILGIDFTSPYAQSTTTAAPATTTHSTATTTRSTSSTTTAAHVGRREPDEGNEMNAAHSVVRSVLNEIVTDQNELLEK